MTLLDGSVHDLPAPVVTGDSIASTTAPALSVAIADIQSVEVGPPDWLDDRKIGRTVGIVIGFVAVAAIMMIVSLKDWSPWGTVGR